MEFELTNPTSQLALQIRKLEIFKIFFCLIKTVKVRRYYSQKISGSCLSSFASISILKISSLTEHMQKKFFVASFLAKIFLLNVQFSFIYVHCQFFAILILLQVFYNVRKFLKALAKSSLKRFFRALSQPRNNFIAGWVNSGRFLCTQASITAETISSLILFKYETILSLTKSMWKLFYR